MGQPGYQSAPAEFIWKVHSYTNEYIRFADTKAGAVITASGGLLGVLLAAKIHHLFTDASFTLTHVDARQTFFGIVSLATFLLLAAALGCAFWAVKPRLWSGRGNKAHPKGVLYWENVARHTGAEYVKEVMALNTDDLVRIPCEHVHVLAGITSQKYFWVNLSMILVAGGSLLAALIVIFSV